MHKSPYDMNLEEITIPPSPSGGTYSEIHSRRTVERESHAEINFRDSKLAAAVGEAGSSTLSLLSCKTFRRAPVCFKRTRRDCLVSRCQFVPGEQAVGGRLGSRYQRCRCCRIGHNPNVCKT